MIPSDALATLHARTLGCCGDPGSYENELRSALFAARHQLVAAFGIIRSHGSEEHVQNYQKAIMRCDAALQRAGREGAILQGFPEEEPHVCQSCKRTFTTKHGLGLHVKHAKLRGSHA
mgnify:FL=1